MDVPNLPNFQAQASLAGTNVDEAAPCQAQQSLAGLGRGYTPQTQVLPSGTLLPRHSCSQSLDPILTLETWPGPRL